MLLVQDGTQCWICNPWRLESCLQTCERLLFITRRQQKWNLAQTDWPISMAKTSKDSPWNQKHLRIQRCLLWFFCKGVWKCKHPFHPPKTSITPKHWPLYVQYFYVICVICIQVVTKKRLKRKLGWKRDIRTQHSGVGQQLLSTASKLFHGLLLRCTTPSSNCAFSATMDDIHLSECQLGRRHVPWYEMKATLVVRTMSVEQRTVIIHTNINIYIYIYVVL